MPNAFAAGAPFRTRWGSLQRSPRPPPVAGYGEHFRDGEGLEGRGKVKRRGEKREETGGEGGEGEKKGGRERKGEGVGEVRERRRGWGRKGGRSHTSFSRN